MFTDPTGMIANAIDGPGDGFGTLHEAIKDFGMEYNGFSIAYNQEISTLFYSYCNDQGETEFSYIRPLMGANAGMAYNPSPDDFAKGVKANGHKNATLEVLGHSHSGAQENEIFEGRDMYNPSFYNPTDLTLALNQNTGGNGFGRPVDMVITSPNGGAYYFSVSQYPNINPDRVDFHTKLNSFNVPIITGLPSDKALGKKSRLGINSDYSDPAIMPINFNPETHKGY